MMLTMHWDYIIVGAGSSGCALAYELVQRAPGKTILILEAGTSDRSAFIKIPAGQVRALANRDWGYRSQPDPSRHGAVDSWLRGRVLGGCSSINGMMYVRGAAEDFNGWPAGWSADEVLPVFRDLETSDQPGLLRGRRGQLHVRTVRHPHATTQAFIESAVACGNVLNTDYNGETQEGVAYAQLSQRRGLRRSAADAFLKPLLGKANIKLLLDAVVEKVELVNGRAVAVRFRRAGETQRATGQDIVLCAGAINSPKLLLLSGIGDKQELDRLGIDALIDAPAVGRNLREHPLVRLTYRTSVTTYNLTAGWGQRLGIAAAFLARREGPIANLFEATAFLRSTACQPAPDIQLHFLPLGYLAKPDGMIELAPFPAVSILVNKSHPRSSGQIRLASARPDDAPLIECRLLEDEADVDTLVNGIQAVRAIMRSEPIAGLIQEELAPSAGCESPAALRECVRRHTGIAFHPVGTCRMGTGDGTVVAPNLRVHGTENLWIADASIIPHPLSGNTNAVCMMIGMKLGKTLAAAGHQNERSANRE